MTKPSLPGSVLALLLFMAGMAPARAQEVLPFDKVSPFARVSTEYRITLRPFNIGSFNIGSLKQLSVNRGNQYEIRNVAHVSLFSVLRFDWKWVSNASGVLTSQGPRPASHQMTFTKSGKRQSYDITFVDNNVTAIVTPPVIEAQELRVPVTDQHLLGVIDPLSAFLMPTLYEDLSGSPCNRSFRLFDGKLRFNVHVSPKRTVLLKKKTSTGRRLRAEVCRVKWEPVAGHRANSKTASFMAKTNDIEVYLIPVEGYRGHYVPYLISAPTPYGSVSIKSVRVDLTTASEERISMIK